MTDQGDLDTNGNLEALQVELETAGVGICEVEWPDAEGSLRLAGLHLHLPNGNRYLVVNASIEDDHKRRILRDALACIKKGDERPRRYDIDPGGDLSAWFKP